MILKIKKKEGNWIYFDGIKRVNVDYCEDYKLTQIIPDNFKKGELLNEYEKHLGVRQLSKNCDKDGNRDIILNSILSVDEYVLDEQEILKQYHEDENGKRNFWGVKMLYVYDEKDNMKAIACYSWNDNIYLLNNDGKTLERL